LKRSRRILLALLLLPIALASLGIWNARRLRAIADRGQTVQAQIVGYETIRSGKIAYLEYAFKGKSYAWNVGAKEAPGPTVAVRFVPENPARPYVGPPLTPEIIRTKSTPFLWAAAALGVLLLTAYAYDGVRIRRIKSP
jgi:hypothetical protein